MEINLITASLLIGGGVVTTLGAMALSARQKIHQLEAQLQNSKARVNKLETDLLGQISKNTITQNKLDKANREIHSLTKSNNKSYLKSYCDAAEEIISARVPNRRQNPLDLVKTPIKKSKHNTSGYRGYHSSQDDNFFVETSHTAPFVNDEPSIRSVEPSYSSSSSYESGSSSSYDSCSSDSSSSSSYD